METAYVKRETTKMFLDAARKRSIELLWGDQVRIVERNGNVAKVKARGQTGTVSTNDLGPDALLELYFVDVGQGDGVLIRTPDGRHVLIDAGYNRAKQAMGKNAADFVDWKFCKDYGAAKIELDVVIASHNDADHYGGLWDLLNPAAEARGQLDIPTKDVSVEAFYHAGIGWWKGPGHDRWLGEFRDQPNGQSFFVQLMEDRAQVTEATKPGATHQLQGEWGKFLACVLSTRRRDGKPTPIARLSHKTGHVPGFGPGQDVQMKVLAPIEHTIDGKPAIRRLAPADSKNTNGNSILLRLDYGNVRILLTGDLNTLSQHALEQHYQDELKREFACDVAKACHHGSDDVSYRFLEAMNPAVTVISSGDSEGHDHPRPAIVAASATAGYRQTDTRSDRLISPLIYSTELARSLNVGRPTKLKAIAADGTAIELDEKQLAKVEVECEQVISGALGATKRIKRLDSNARLVTKSIYGLVNVRTDGKKILCATLNETDDQTWQVKTLTSRF